MFNTIRKVVVCDIFGIGHGNEALIPSFFIISDIYEQVFWVTLIRNVILVPSVTPNGTEIFHQYIMSDLFFSCDWLTHRV